MTFKIFRTLLIFFVSVGLAATARAGHIPAIPGRALANEPAQPLPPIPVLNSKRVALGEKLFHDARLSSDGTISCASCHDLTKGGADGKRLSPVIGGGFRTRNTPSIFNAALLPSFNWDGNVASLRQEVITVIQSKTALDIRWDRALALLQSDAMYTAIFQGAYGRQADRELVVDAIVTYIESLATPDSRFDRFLRGEFTALTDAEQDGYGLFKTYGCSSCHQGRLMGGTLFAPFGVFGNYVEDRGNITESDYGRFTLTKNPQDNYVFRVPSLRNVALTAPYFHDGNVKDLEKAVELMGKYMIGRDLSKNDIGSLVLFLKTLTAPRAEPSR